MTSQLGTHGLPALIAAAREARDRGEITVLATIVATQGSTYRKAGARMLLHADGTLTGILGGGCFEGDLAERAEPVFAGGPPIQVRYDMRSDAEAIWGLGLGCNGAVDIFLQGLDPANDYQPLESLASLAESGGRLITVLASDRTELPAGTSWTEGQGPDGLAEPEPGVSTDNGLTLFNDFIQSPPRLLICGAGPDAVPLVQMAGALGWVVTVMDHRPAHVVPERFPAAREVIGFEGAVDGSADAVLVMSHNFPTDIRYLRALSGSSARYLGVLGPPDRRDALLDALNDPDLEARLKGPIGLSLGGELPEDIALSVLSEIQAHLHGRDGTPMSEPRGG